MATEIILDNMLYGTLIVAIIIYSVFKVIQLRELIKIVDILDKISNKK